ncbi:efflux RND transporter periplasmic adaptor subunit [Acidovorax lacteus]|uniref:Efflux RND transporter periplasmic adaptor subunit n=1 Tax=Acidovorax lacteus TaxID=1924988 RepID=A0ABP8KXV1_9BURK
MPLLTRKSWALGAGILAAVGLLAWAFAPRPQPVEVAEVTRGAFERTIEEDARTRLRERYVLAAPVAGRLQRMAVREGDAVAAGAVVARIQPASPGLLDARSQRELQARLQAADAGVQRARARVQATEAALAQAEADATRTDALARQGFVAPAQREVAELALRSARSNRVAASQEQRMAESEREQARAAQAWWPESSGRVLELRAPVAGRVLRVPQTSEGPVAAGAVVLELGDTARLEVVAPLLTTDALLLQPGTPVRIVRWGGPGALPARVRLVEPAASTKVSALGVEEQRVPVVVEWLGEPPAALGDGFRVVAQFVMQAQADAVRVPVGALFPWPQAVRDAAAGTAADPPLGVFVLQGGRAVLQPVQLHARGTDLAWVREGLQPGDRVVVYPPASLRDGARVRVRDPG